MEKNNSPTPLNHQQLGLSKISNNGKRILKVIADVNNLIAFKLTVSELADWAKQIDRIAPEVDIKALRFLMDCFATDTLEYDRNKGVQNIFNGLKRIKKEGDGYVLMRQSWL